MKKEAHKLDHVNERMNTIFLRSVPSVPITRNGVFYERKM